MEWGKAPSVSPEPRSTDGGAHSHNPILTLSRKNIAPVWTLLTDTINLVSVISLQRETNMEGGVTHACVCKEQESEGRGVREVPGHEAPRGKTTRLGRTCAVTVKLSHFYL